MTFRKGLAIAVKHGSGNAAALEIDDDLGGGSKHYLSYSLFGLLMREGKLARDKTSKKLSFHDPVAPSQVATCRDGCRRGSAKVGTFPIYRLLRT